MPCVELGTGPAAAVLLPGNPAKGKFMWCQTCAGPECGHELCLRAAQGLKSGPVQNKGSTLDCRTWSVQEGLSHHPPFPHALALNLMCAGFPQAAREALQHFVHEHSGLHRPPMAPVLQSDTEVSAHSCPGSTGLVNCWMVQTSPVNHTEL